MGDSRMMLATTELIYHHSLFADLRETHEGMQITCA